MYYFEPMDLEMHCLKIDYDCILDEKNGFVNGEGECEITAEISVDRIDSEEEAGIEGIFKGFKNSRSPPKGLDGVIKLQGHCVRVNKELFSWHSEYFKNIFNNANFEECSKKEVDLTDFTYKQFRLLYKHIYVESVYLPGRYLYTDGVVEFRLKSNDATNKSQKLLTLADVQEYIQQHTSLQAQDDSSEKSSSKALCELNDFKQKETLRTLEWLLGFCVSAEYERNVNLTVSAENIADLLCVGNYFQISKIMDSCKEFLGRKYDYPDFSSEDRMRLVEKYNLTSVTVPRFHKIISQDTTSTEVLVNVKFLDTGSEEMCIVNESYYESPMLIKTLYRHALSSLYSTGVCNNPLQYKLVNVRISDPNMGCWEDCECVDDCTFMNGIVWRSRIYRFEVRQFKAGPSSHVSTSQSQPWDCFMATSSEQLTSKHDSFSRLNGPKHVPRTDEQSTNVPRCFAPAKILRDRTRIEILVNVNFLDTGIEKMCSVAYKNPMLIKTLYRHALSSLHSTGVCDSPSKYKLVNVRVSDPKMGYSEYCECEDDRTFINGIVWRSRIYSFEVRRLKGGASSQTANVSTLQLQSSTFMVPSESSTGSFGSISKSISTEIPVQVNFLDNGNEEICSVKHVGTMNILSLYSDALSNLYYKGVCNHPLEYKLVNVRISDPNMGCSEDYECVDFEDDRTFLNGIVWRSRIYSFEVRQLKGGASSQTDNVSTSQSQPSTFMVPSEASTSSFGSISNSISTEIPVQVNFLDNGNEEMCSVLLRYSVNILSLFFDVLNSLYYKGVCDHPLQYKLVNVRISDPSTPSDCQIVNVEDNPAAKFDFVHTSRIYSLEVRQIDGKDSGFESFTFMATSSKQLKSKHDSFSRLNGPKHVPRTDEQSTNVPRLFAPAKILRDRTRIEILVNVNFLDTGIEKMCSVAYKNPMLIKTLYRHALSSLHSTRVCDSPLKYKLVNVRVSDPNMGCSQDCECVNVDDDRTFINGIVWRSRIYSFEVRQLNGGASSQTDNVSTSQSQPSTFMVFSTDFAHVRNIKRKESILISVQLVFLDNEEEKTVTVLYTNGMTVQKLFDFALLNLLYISALFEIVTMHASDADSTSDREPYSFDIPINASSTVNRSYAYRFRVRRKTGENSTSEECNQRLMKFLKLDDV